MLSWINFAIMLLSAMLFLYFYLKSVAPAALEKVIGPRAYPLCGRYRAIAIVFEMINLVTYIVYYFYPLPGMTLPETFPWRWWVSAVIVVVILLPSGWLMLRGMIDAGAEAIAPDKSHTLYGGIYNKIRHPQAVGEVFLWWVAAFFLHSPFLALFSLIFIPIFLIMCEAEENDLLLRYGDSYAEYMRRVGAYFPRRPRSCVTGHEHRR